MTVDSLDDLSPQFVGGTLLVWPPDPTANAVALGRQVVHAVDAQAAGATRAEVVLPGGKTLAGDDLGATLYRWVGGPVAFAVFQEDATIGYQSQRFDCPVTFRIGEEDVLTVISDTRVIHPEDLRLIEAGARRALRAHRAHNERVTGEFWTRA